MHPELFTIPGLGWTIPTYGFCVVVGFVAAIWISVRRAKRVGANPEVVTSVALVGGLLGALGARGMHFVHHLRDAVQTQDMGVREAVSTFFAGGEILGGVLLGFVGVIAYLLIKRQPVRLYLDILTPPLVLAMGIGRLGCLGFGCCWGAVCETEGGEKAVPWAVQFPYGAPAYLVQWHRGQLTVPDELLWNAPRTKDRTPIGRKMLVPVDPSVNEVLEAYGHKFSELAERRRADPNSEATARCRDELHRLQNQLPGDDREQAQRYAAAAVHLERLSRQRGGETVSLADLRAIAAGLRSRWVHPTQVYDAISLGLMFALLTAIFYRRRHQGVVLGWAMILYAVSRFLQELIRADNPRDVAGLTVSQFLSLGIAVVGIFVLIIVVKVAPVRAGGLVKRADLSNAD